jgi:hypothetical protein
MGIIFGESANLEIGEELNKHLNKFKNLEEFHNSNEWYNVKRYLDKYSTTCHPHTIYPKGILSTEQWNSFDKLRKSWKVQNRYNVLAKEREEKEAERKRQAQATKELMLKRDAEEEKKQFKRQEEQRQQEEMMRQRQQESFEESVRQRMRMNNLY